MFELKNKKILVTGASGMFGTQLCRQLAPMNEVWGLASFNHIGKEDLLAGWGVNIVKRNVVTDSISDIPEDFDIIFHELVILYEADKDAAVTRDANAYFTGRLMEQCFRSKAIVFGSTGGIYQSSTKYDKETDAPGSVGWYATSKLGMEYIGTYMCRKYSIPGVILRYYWPYGSEQGRITRMMKSIRNGESVSISSSQEDRYQPIFIEDIGNLTIGAVPFADIDPPIYNMAGMEEIAWSQQAKMIGEAIGVVPKFDMSPEPRLSHLADISKLTSRIGAPQVSLKDGIQRVKISLGF